MALQGESYITTAGRDAIAQALNTGQDVEIGSYGLSSQDLAISETTTTTDITNFLTENITVGSKNALDGKVYVELRKTPAELNEDIRVISLYLKDGTLFIVIKPTYFIPKDRGLDFGLGIGIGSNDCELSLVNVIDGAKANIFGDCEINFKVKSPQDDCDAVNWGVAKKLGMKNLWIDGSMQLWDDGLTGEITENYNPRYAYNMMVLRHHSYVLDGVMTGVQGSTYTWEQINDASKSWLKITHVGALEYGYIGQRWDLPTLSYLKGKTVSISFLYKTNIYTVGHVSFYSEQNAIHDGVAQGDVMATSEEYTIVGDGNIHKIETTVTLLDDNIVPDPSGYVGILLTYGTLADGIPDGYIQFTDIQVEVNDKCTDYEFTNLALTREKMNYYYRKGSTGYYDASSPSGNKYISVEFGTDMRVVPAVTNDSIWVTGATAGTIPTAITKKGFMLNAPDNTAVGCYWTADARMY